MLSGMECRQFVVRRDRLGEHEVVTTPRAALAAGDASCASTCSASPPTT